MIDISDKMTLVVYMTKEGEGWVQHSCGLLETEVTRFLRFSYDNRRKKRGADNGERLYISAFGSPRRESVSIPTEWVVTHVECYEPDMKQMPVFRDVVIAYCESKPLSAEEFKQLVDSSEPKVTVDSFGGDQKKYQEWLKAEEKTQEVEAVK